MNDEDYKTISADEALKITQSEKDYLIVDVRTQEEYEKKHIPGALLLPLADLRAGDFDKLPDESQILLVHCETGKRAEVAAKILADNGYENVYNFGGIGKWKGKLTGTEIKD